MRFFEPVAAVCKSEMKRFRRKQAANHNANLQRAQGAATRLLILSLLLFMVFPQAFAKEQLPKRYKDWLDREVTYIITRDEKDAFRKLGTDAERDQFIERFWELRNPTPGAPTNPYRDEHYQRLEYATQHFSPTGRGDGWATDMGRVYITLGPPQQKARYVSQSGVRGMEIWFYQSVHPALPPFFYVVFYEKDFGDFRLYSPYMDGPTKLVTGMQAEQGRAQAVQQIDHILGREVARTTLTLLPNEPVNMNDAESTLQSDLLLGNIKDLANHPFTVEALRLRRALTEEVTHRVLLSGELLNVLCVPLRDARGNVRLHYALRLPQPEDFAVAQTDGRFYYSLEALVRVLGPDGKEIFNRTRKISRYLSKDELDSVKGKPVAYEGWLPLAPGKYKLEFEFANVVSKTAFTGSREITIPEVGSQDYFVTEPVPFSQVEMADPATAEFLPFTGGGVRFRPYVGKELALVPGQDLEFFYQIWRPRANDQNGGSAKLLVDYAYGRPSFSGTAQTIHEEVAKDQFDTHGSMINGKKIGTTDMGVGNYRLTISLTDPGAQQKRFSTMPFVIVSDSPSPSDTWRIDDDALAEYVTSGQADLDRGLTYLAKGETQTATASFVEALRKNPANERARARLVDYYFAQRDFGKVVDLFSHSEVTAQTEEGTILTVADSLDRTGKANKAVDLLESALKVKPPSGPLYLALGSYYQHLGNSDRADNFQKKGRALMTETPPKSE
jgi:GWxTD domain-containing protein